MHIWFFAEDCSTVYKGHSHCNATVRSFSKAERNGPANKERLMPKCGTVANNLFKCDACGDVRCDANSGDKRCAKLYGESVMVG